ncbi:hypothetical protein KC19_5G132400 [Ceratodon purpureus]|uniref:Secreted protein n=1 Tax=Ceratodon purpureus TaxID=3225 RepID=A0A8T0I2V0_CERPU|nr:hypothetical protein KC19_5G132400 [Ceratodon purpureus]
MRIESSRGLLLLLHFSFHVVTELLDDSVCQLLSFENTTRNRSRRRCSLIFREGILNLRRGILHWGGISPENPS